MKIKKVSIATLSLLLCLSGLHAVPPPENPADTNNNLPTLPTNPSVPTPPSPPEEIGNLTLGLNDSGTTNTVSLSSTNGGIIEFFLPVDLATSWCYVQNVPADKELLDFSYTPITYGYVTDPDDSSKVKPIMSSHWLFFPQTEGSVILSFYARNYDGQLFPDPYNKVYTFTINVTK